MGFSAVSQAQNATQIEQIGYLLEDALLYSKIILFLLQMQLSIKLHRHGCILQRKKLWEVNAGLHFNVFKVPGADRDFTIQNSDFKFFISKTALQVLWFLPP